MKCEGLSKSFGATHAVSDISFSLHAGEILALVGENGAGKSTLMNLISGSISPNKGQIVITPMADKDYKLVSMVHQELSLFDNLTVSENLQLDSNSSELFINEKSSRDRAQEIISRLGINVSVDSRVGDLSVGQRQLVEVAKAVGVAPTLLILDEPTSALENDQVEILFTAVRRLRDLGTAVIFVSHRMHELFELCDKLLVMRDGRQVEFGSIAGHTPKSLAESMVGRQSSELYPARPDVELKSRDELPFVELRNLSIEGYLYEISLKIRPGRVTAIAGLEGHGQGVIAELLAGARKHSSGSLLLFGKETNLHSPRDAVGKGIGYVPPNRRLDGLLLEKSVSANVLLAAAPRLSPGGFSNLKKERSIVNKLVSRLEVKTTSTEQSVIELSGGNQQKVLVGRWLIYPGLRALILNDPTRGVDVKSRSQIYSVISELADGGVAVVLVSTDMQEILGLSDEVYVVYSGHITGHLMASEADENSIMRHSMGLDESA